MRHYSKIAKEPEIDNIITKPGHEKADETLIYQIAVLAKKLRFDSKEIRELARFSPDQQIMVTTLRKARPPEQYKYNNELFEALVEQIITLFRHTVPVTPQPDELDLVKDTKLAARRGFLPRKIVNYNNQLLFINKIYNMSPLSRSINSFFVRQSIFFTFFRKVQREVLLNATATGGPLPHSLLFLDKDVTEQDCTSGIEDAMNYEIAEPDTGFEGVFQADKQRERPVTQFNFLIPFPAGNARVEKRQQIKKIVGKKKQAGRERVEQSSEAEQIEQTVETEQSLLPEQTK
jgi:hypothetical protein